MPAVCGGVVGWGAVAVHCYCEIGLDLLLFAAGGWGGGHGGWRDGCVEAGLLGWWRGRCMREN